MSAFSLPRDICIDLHALLKRIDAHIELENAKNNVIGNPSAGFFGQNVGTDSATSLNHMFYLANGNAL